VTVGDVSDLLQGGSGDDIIEAIEESTNKGEDTMIAGGGNDIIEGMMVSKTPSIAVAARTRSQLIRNPPMNSPPTAMTSEGGF
jgi:hypothetical protein